MRSLRACEVAALAFCRLLETWARGDPQPCTAGRRQAALRRAAERAETALADLEAPLDRYLLELESDVAEGRPWYGEPGAGELVEWEPVLRRAGVVGRAAPRRAGLPRARRARPGPRRALGVAPTRAVPDRTSLWAGLFDLRENLFGAADDLRALAA